MSRSALRWVLAASLSGLLMGGPLLYAGALSLQTGRDGSGPGGRRAESEEKPEGAIHPPAPRNARASAGRGKALIYMLDRNQERIPDPRKDAGARFLETERTLQWAVVTGVIDHRKVWASLGMGAQSDRISILQTYHRVELERSTLEKDGTWSGWQRVVDDGKRALLDNLPLKEEERISHEFLASPLVDPLPWLTEGSWEGVDVEEFLPPERRNEKNRRLARLPAPPPQRAAPPRLMLRTFDFAAEPGRSYRYRSRVVLVEPGWRRIENPSKHLVLGPWSEATEVVTIPAPAK
jgi:hypothetical protein